MTLVYLISIITGEIIYEFITMEKKFIYIIYITKIQIFT